MVKIVILFLMALTLYFVCLSVGNVAEAAGFDFAMFQERLSFGENWYGSDWPFLKSVLWMGAANMTLVIALGFKKENKNVQS